MKNKRIKTKIREEISMKQFSLIKQLALVTIFFVFGACSSSKKEKSVMEPTTHGESSMMSSSKANGTNPRDVSGKKPGDSSSQANNQQNSAEASGEEDMGDKSVNMGNEGLPDVEGTERSGATCKKGNDERMVSVIDTRQGHCGVVYNKFGKKKTVAYAKYEMKFCDGIFDSVISNLLALGFDCGEAGSPKVPEEMEVSVKGEDSGEAPKESQGEKAPEGKSEEKPEGKKDGLRKDKTELPEEDAVKPEPQESSATETETDSSSPFINADSGFPDLEGNERSGVTCKNGDNERTVSVIDTHKGPCGVVYNKSGKKKTVAYAKFDMTYCDKVFNRMVNQLIAGGFDCGGDGNSAAVTQEQPPTQEQSP